MSDVNDPRQPHDRPDDQPPGRPVEIDWEVICVFDPDGLGSDFAYTVGLAGHGVPERHVWARPPDGADPGADWKFSDRDLTSLVNEVAVWTIDGRVGVGDSWEARFDGGLTTVRFTLHVGGSAPDLDTFQLEPGTPLLALRWELVRPAPEPDRWPVDEALRALLAAERTRVEHAAEDRRALWQAGPSGPVEPGVVERVDAGAWADLLHTYRLAVRDGANAHWLDALDALAAHVRELSAAEAVTIEAARLAGRGGELGAARDAATADVAAVVATARRTLAVLEPDGDPECYLLGVEHHVGHWLRAAYGALVVDDMDEVIPGPAIAAALGWLRAFADPAAATACFVRHLGPTVAVTDPARMRPRPVTYLHREAWIRGCVRAAARGVGAPLVMDVHDALVALCHTGDAGVDAGLAPAA